jgi:hypothetical protein
VTLSSPRLSTRPTGTLRRAHRGPGGEGCSGVSAQIVAALIGGGLALTGLVVERLLRTWGRLWCEVSDWELTFMSGEKVGGTLQEFVPERPEEAKWARYSVHLDLFNGKEIPVGLRDISIVFSCDDGEVVRKPLSTTGGVQRPYGGPVDYPLMRIINLLPRQWDFVALHNELRGPDNVRLLLGWRKAEFVGQRQRRGFLERKTFRKTIASRHPFPDPWKR